ncbi:MAG TPA: hypothetical protein VF256_04910, partial [Streptosporangiaceae bacterium]
QRTSMSADRFVPPKSSMWALGFLREAIGTWQAFTASVVATYRNRRVPLDAVWYPAKWRVMTTGADPAAVPAVPATAT